MTWRWREIDDALPPAPRRDRADVQPQSVSDNRLRPNSVAPSDRVTCIALGVPSMIPRRRDGTPHVRHASPRWSRSSGSIAARKRGLTSLAGLAARLRQLDPSAQGRPALPVVMVRMRDSDRAHNCGAAGPSADGIGDQCLQAIVAPRALDRQSKRRCRESRSKIARSVTPMTRPASPPREARHRRDWRQEAEDGAAGPAFFDSWAAPPDRAPGPSQAKKRAREYRRHGGAMERAQREASRSRNLRQRIKDGC